MVDNSATSFVEKEILALQKQCQILAQQKAVAQEKKQSDIYVQTARQLNNVQNKLVYWQNYKKRNLAAIR